MAKAALTQEDVQRLLTDPSPESRAGAASKIAEEFNAENFGDAEREMAEEIFRLMVKDAEVRVREALAINLKNNPNIPHDVALTLAKDVETVAFPVIQYSEVLNDDDLLGIVASQDETKQLAVAQRAIVSETVSAALVDTQNENVVTALVSNEGAEISNQSMEKVVDTLGESTAVQEAMIGRTKLPITVTERLVSMVSDQLQAQLVARHELPPAMAADLILQSRERATVTLSSEGDANDVSDLVAHLHENGRLTSSIILRALCMGDFRFLEQALSTLSGLPLTSARKLIHDPGGLGLHSVFVTKPGCRNRNSLPSRPPSLRPASWSMMASVITASNTPAASLN